MHFKTKYSIGDTVWMPYNQINFIEVGDCPVCKGSGKSPFNEKASCTAKADLRHVCRKGKLCTWKASWEPVDYKIHRISVEIDVDCGCEEVYYINGEDDIGYTLSEFYTREACEEECKKRNKERPIL